MQAKLEVGAVDDPLEQEADRIADQVMRCDMRKAEQNDDEHVGVQPGMRTTAQLRPANLDLLHCVILVLDSWLPPRAHSAC